MINEDNLSIINSNERTENRLTVYKHYTIKDKETIRQIAFKLYRDQSRWQMLVNLNDLHYPYIVNTPDEKLQDPNHLLCRGDDLLLPNNEEDARLADDGLLKESNTKYYQPDYYDTVLGQDIKLDISTDVPLPDRTGVLVSQGRDFETVVGIDNLKQSLIMRILTRYGTLYYHPHYGSHLPDMLGKPMNAKRLSDAVVELSRTITTDERVAKVEVDKNLLSYDQIFMRAKVTPVDYNTAFNIYIYKSESGEVSVR